MSDAERPRSDERPREALEHAGEAGPAGSASETLLVRGNPSDEELAAISTVFDVLAVEGARRTGPSGRRRRRSAWEQAQHAFAQGGLRADDPLTGRFGGRG